MPILIRRHRLPQFAVLQEMRIYEMQAARTCIQTYYNLYGVMPGAQELAEMIGEDVPALDEKQAA